MTLERPATPEALESVAGPFLATHEAENCLLLGLAAQLRTRTATLPTAAPYLGVVRDADAVAGAALIAGYVVVLSTPIGDRAIELLARDIALAAPDVPGVVGEKRAAGRFAEIWTAITGRPHRLGMSERIFRLDRVIPPRPVAGQMRLAAAEDRSLLADWLAAFALEALGQSGERERTELFADLWISRPPGRAMYFWVDGARPVSMVGVSGPTPNGIRVAPVYTPAELRGRGYASALTAAVSQAQIDAGKRYCFLFTDLANPTSNHIYQTIGYQPVQDAAEYRFEPPR